MRGHALEASWYSPNTRRSASAISPSVALLLDRRDDHAARDCRRRERRCSTASSAARHSLSLRLARSCAHALDLLALDRGIELQTRASDWASASREPIDADDDVGAAFERLLRAIGRVLNLLAG